MENASCTCPAGKSDVCNHVMALLFELAEYSLKQLESIPDEPACTSQLRKWGVPGELQSHKEPVMSTSIQKNVNKKGINCTLYDPRINYNSSAYSDRLQKMTEDLRNIDKRIGFPTCVTPLKKRTSSSTKYREFFFGSPLSYQLLMMEFNFKLVTNIVDTLNKNSLTRSAPGDLPHILVDTDSVFVPMWQPYTQAETEYFKSMTVTLSQARHDERLTIKQSGCEKWHTLRKHRIASSNAYKVYK